MTPPTAAQSVRDVGRSETLRGFLKFLALQLSMASTLLLTFVWVNAFTFGYETTVYINHWGEAFVEGLLIFGLLWPVLSVGLYLLAVDAGVIGELPADREEAAAR